MLLCLVLQASEGQQVLRQLGAISRGDSGGKRLEPVKLIELRRPFTGS